MVVAKFLFRTPVIADRISVGLSIEIDVESTVVGGVWCYTETVYDIILNNGVGLVGKGVNTSGIIQLPCKVCYLIASDDVVVHPRIFGSPSPSYTDAGIVDVVDYVVRDARVTDIAGSNGDSSPVFKGSINHGVLVDEQSLTLSGEVGVRAMYLTRTLGKRTSKDGCSSNMFKLIIDDGAVADACNVVESCACQVAEPTTREIDMSSIRYADGSYRTFYPCLILQGGSPRKSLLCQFVGIDDGESALQRDVTFV